MRTLNKLILFTIAALLCWSCQEDNQPPQNFPVISNVTLTEITDSTALCTITVNTSEAIFLAGIDYGTDPSQLTVSFSSNDISGNTISLLIKNLVDDMVYYYKVYVKDKIGSTVIYSEINEFKTQSSPYGSTFSNGITPARSFRDGDGTQNNPYLITNAQQLKKLVDDVNNGNGYANTFFKLTTDIQVTADEWIPIGYGHDYYLQPCFRGNFDGNGHSINGTLQTDRFNRLGFFGTLYRAHIANFTIAAKVKNEHPAPTSYTSTGAISGQIWGGVIENCHVNGNVTGGGSNTTGGIAGSNLGEIINCTISTSGEVTGEGWATGGITGANSVGTAGSTIYRGKITNCTNNATVSGTNIVGGLAGNNNWSEIHTSLNTGNIIGNTRNTGGITGSNVDYDDSHIYSCCTNLGTVNGQAANANNQIGNGKEVEPCPEGHAKR